MKKITLTNNQWAWIWVIGFIILPAVLVRALEQEDIVRIFGMLIIFSFLPIFLIVVAVFVPKEKFLLHPEAFERKYGKKTFEWFAMGLRLVGIGGGILIFFWGSLPVLGGIYRYSVLGQSPVIVEQTVGDLNSGFLDPFSLIGTTINFAEQKDESYSLWYPSHQMRVGERYRFTILPGTKVVLNSERIK